MLDLSDDQKQDAAVLEVMAQSQLARKQYQDAKQSVEQLLAQQSNSAQAHFLLAQVYAGLGNRTDTKQELESVIKLSPKHFAAHLALARLLAQEGQNEKVTEQLTVLNEISPDNPDVLALKASLAQAQGDQKTASTLLQDVFEQIPSTASMLAVARQELAMGNQMASLELQKQWMTEHPDDLVASMALADAYINQNQVERAITLYQRVLEQDEQNVNALNNLAWQLRDKEPVKALQYAKRAVALAPESAEVMDTLSVVFLKNNDIKSAKRYTERALAKKPKDPSFRYHSAMIDTAAGDKASAIETLQSLLAEDSNFSEKSEAQELLAKLKAGG
jgi:tetratricopeptide (TPR) repeat protein